jgi:acyl-CoA thioesterase I
LSITLKIVALGTSLMASPGWTDKVRSLVEQCARAPVALDVVAKSGATSRWGLAQTPKLIADGIDVLLMEFAANDSNLRRFVSLSESRSNHEEIIRAVRKAHPSAKIFLVAVSPTWGPRGFLIRPWLERYYALYAQLAETEGVDFIDARPRWDMSTIRETVPDGLHPTPQAMQRILAPYVADRLCAAHESKGATPRILRGDP